MQIVLVFTSLLNKKNKCEELAVRVLDQKECRLPETNMDFFYDGFANWFLERYERADYDFERSKTEPSDHYNVLMGVTS